MIREATEMINIFGEEEFKPLIRYQKVIPGYFVSKTGSGIIGKKGNLLSKWNNSGYHYTSIRIKSDFYDDYTYATHGGKDDITLKIAVHRAVMESWRPIDEYPPDEIADEWFEVITPEMVGQPRIPPKTRQWVRDTALVDHKDPDPTNNHLNNLRWVKPKDNEPNRKKYKDALND
jgi:hypothetical protein